MDTNSNGYIFLYASVMVIVVAAILSFTAMQLQPMQEQNVMLEKKQSILQAIKIDTSRDASSELYDKYIKETVVIDNEGNVKPDMDAFDVNMSEELDKAPENRSYPLYINEQNGQKTYIVPVRGKGLWGPIWGYVAIKDDFNTVFGATFDHKSETPGLGAEISTGEFQDQFEGKKLMNEKGEFVAIDVKKGGRAAPDDPHAVDGISGGTITSNGLEAMVHDIIKDYLPYFKKLKNTQS